MPKLPSLQNTFFLVLFQAFLLTFAPGTMASDSKISQPDNWTLKTQAGKSVSLQDLRGRPLVLHFWATWCPYCKKLQPGLESLYKKYQKQGLQLVAISFNEEPDARPEEVLRQRGHQFMTLINGDEVARKLGVSGTPTTLFIHADGSLFGTTRTSDPNNPALEKAVLRIVNNAQR